MRMRETVRVRLRSAHTPRAADLHVDQIQSARTVLELSLIHI